MPTACPQTDQLSGSVIAQHLFLGASVNGFNTNLGWGGSRSTLSVDLVNDFGSFGSCNIQNNPNLEVFKVRNSSSYDIDNHYYDCVGDSCYIDEKGFNYDPNRSPRNPDGPDVPQPSTKKIIPGKVYHVATATGLVSRYWRKHDPGFFGAGTLVDVDGQVRPRYVTETITQNGQEVPIQKLLPYRYNIIGVPVIFRYGYFTFGGVVTSWDATIDGSPLDNTKIDIFNSSISYRVEISSPDVILENSQVILDKYSGSIFCSLANQIGGPTNYTGPLGKYTGKMINGNIPNVFNVYGFLESYGFGNSLKNDDGIPLAYALDSLALLTSAKSDSYTVNQLPTQNIFIQTLGAKLAFSPFGRIIAPIPLTDAIDIRDTKYYGKPRNSDFGANSFGILNPILDSENVPRTQLALDLSEIPRPPLDIRVTGNQGVMSALDLIRQACERTNRDFYTTLVVKDGINFIKVKTINRGINVPINTIENTIKQIVDSNLPVTQSSFGQNDNRATPRVMIIGANQKRLYQTKSFLLGYSNAQLIYHPVLKKFVDYYRFGKSTSATPPKKDKGGETKNEEEVALTISKDRKFVDSCKIPLAFSTRNIELCTAFNGPVITQIWSNEQALAGDNFSKQDPGFSDIPVGGRITPVIGNYNPAAIFKMKEFTTEESERTTTTTFTVQGSRPTPQGEAEVGSQEGGPGNVDEDRPIPPAGEGIVATEEEDSSSSANTVPRYLPLYQYSISPFFGFANDIKIPVDAGVYTNRYMRPVYFDTASGQILVVCRDNELPALTLGRLPPLFATRPADLRWGTRPIPISMAGQAPINGEAGGAANKPQPSKPAQATTTPTISANQIDPFKTSLYNSLNFVITESELRAASKGVDEYLAYCMAKLDFTKPDLFVMLVKAYEAAGKAVWTSPKTNNIDAVGHLGGTVFAGSQGFSGNNTGSNTGIAGAMTGNVQASSFVDILNINFNLILSYEFYNDLIRIQQFIKDLADKFYGQKYAVVLPAVSVYKDRQYFQIKIPSQADTIGVYQGSSKIFYSYEIAEGGAWEEYGNTIDDSILVGSPNYYNFVDDNGLIQPILGYNATAIKDYATEAWCSLNTTQRDEAIAKALPASVTPPALKALQAAQAALQIALGWAKPVAINIPGAQGVIKWLEGVAQAPVTPVASPYSETSCAYIRSNYELSAIARYFSCDKKIVASLDTSNLSNADYTIFYVPDAGREDAYGNRLIGSGSDPCGQSSRLESIQTEKLYIKTSCDKDMVFLDAFNLVGPRAIINSPGVNLASSSTSYRDDPNLTVISNVAAEDLAIVEFYEKNQTPETVYRLIANASEKMNFDKKSTFAPEVIQELEDYGVLGPGEDWGKFLEKLQSDDENTKGAARLKFIKYLLKKLIVPITENKFLIPANNSSNQTTQHYMMAPKKANPVFAAIPLMDNLACYGPWTNYPDLDDPTYAFPDITDKTHIIEQLISDTHIEKKEEFGPWNYGGMAFLDRAVLYEIQQAVSYQTRLESGDFTVAGLPIFSMGGNLIINKTDADINRVVMKIINNIQFHALEFDTYPILLADGTQRPLNELLLDYAGLTISDMRLSVSAGNIATAYSLRTYSAKRGLYSKENSDRLQLFSKDRLMFAKRIENLRADLTRKIISEINDIDKLRRAGESTPQSIDKGRLYGTSPSTMIVGKAKHYLPVGDYQAGRENDPKNLWQKSRFDSWAGLFQTREALNELMFNYSSQAGMSFDGFYSPVSFFPTSQAGTFPISSRFVTDLDKKREVICPGCSNTYKIKIATVEHPCPLCQRSKIFPINEKTVKPVPIKNEVADINFLTYNPIVMPTGDFLNINAQPIASGERARHNISFIARDENHIVDRNILINHNLTKYEDSTTLPPVIAPLDPNPDWSDIDQKYKEDNDISILTNHRFMSFRGPMLLHGWGYDIDGYPVPNSADEPKEVDDKGRPKRFFLKADGTNDLTKDGAFLPTDTQQLGDIIGKGWKKDGGEWKRNRTNKFYLNWAERADLWPVGPIDFRWDYERKVWVSSGDGGGEADPPFIVADGD